MHVPMLYVYVCFVHMCMLVHVEARGWYWLSSSLALHFVSFHLSLTPEFTYWLDWLTSEALGRPPPSPSVLGLQCTPLLLG